MTVYIYTLVDPRKPKLVRYVGQTSNPRQRQLQHCGHKANDSTKSKWIEEMRKDGVLPQLKIVEEADETTANELEKVWGQRFPAKQLTNDIFSTHKRLVFHDRAPRQFSPLRNAADETVRAKLLDSLTRNKWKIARAAREVGLSRPTVYELMARLGLKKPKPAS